MAAFTNPTDPAAILGQLDPHPACEAQMPPTDQTDAAMGLEILDSKGNLKMLPNAWLGHHKDDETKASDTGRLEIDGTYENDKEEHSTAPVNKTTRKKRQLEQDSSEAQDTPPKRVKYTMPEHALHSGFRGVHAKWLQEAVKGTVHDEPQITTSPESTYDSAENREATLPTENNATASEVVGNGQTQSAGLIPENSQLKRKRSPEVQTESDSEPSDRKRVRLSPDLVKTYDNRLDNQLRDNTQPSGLLPQDGAARQSPRAKRRLEGTKHAGQRQSMSNSRMAKRWEARIYGARQPLSTLYEAGGTGDIDAGTIDSVINEGASVPGFNASPHGASNTVTVGTNGVNTEVLDAGSSATQVPNTLATNAGTLDPGRTAGTTEIVKPKAFCVHDHDDETYTAEDYAAMERSSGVFNAKLKAEITAAKERTAKANKARIQNVQAQLAAARRARASAKNVGAALSIEDRIFAQNARDMPSIEDRIFSKHTCTARSHTPQCSLANSSDNPPHTPIRLGSRHNPIVLSPELRQHDTLDNFLGAGQHNNAGGDFEIYEDPNGDVIMPSIEDGFDSQDSESPSSEASTVVPASEEPIQRTQGRFASDNPSEAEPSVSDDSEPGQDNPAWNFEIYEDSNGDIVVPTIEECFDSEDSDPLITPCPMPAPTIQDDPEGLLSSDDSSGTEDSVFEGFEPDQDDVGWEFEIYEDPDGDVAAVSTTDGFVQGRALVQREDPFQDENDYQGEDLSDIENNDYLFTDNFEIYEDPAGDSPAPTTDGNSHNEEPFQNENLSQNEDLSDIENNENLPPTAPSTVPSINDATQHTQGQFAFNDSSHTDLSLLDDLERDLDARVYSHPEQDFRDPASGREYPATTSLPSTTANPAAVRRGGWLVNMNSLFSNNGARTHGDGADISPPVSPRQNPAAVHHHTHEATSPEKWLGVDIRCLFADHSTTNHGETAAPIRRDSPAQDPCAHAFSLQANRRGRQAQDYIDFFNEYYSRDCPATDRDEGGDAWRSIPY